MNPVIESGNTFRVYTLKSQAMDLGSKIKTESILKETGFYDLG
jgi:hypothetical protein